MMRTARYVEVNMKEIFMKISELIDLLQTYQKDYGDLDVKKEVLVKDVNGDFKQEFVSLDFVSVRRPYPNLCKDGFIWF